MIRIFDETRRAEYEENQRLADKRLVEEQQRFAEERQKEQERLGRELTKDDEQRLQNRLSNKEKLRQLKAKRKSGEVLNTYENDLVKQLEANIKLALGEKLEPEQIPF
jgi:signal transduction histidine kinase